MFMYIFVVIINFVSEYDPTLPHCSVFSSNTGQLTIWRLISYDLYTNIPQLNRWDHSTY